MKNSLRKFKRSLKAVSPVIATLLMIVIAVAASLVAYAWVMGYLGFTTAKVGKAVQIQSITNPAETTGEVTVYVQNVGDSDITLSNIYVNGVANDPTTAEIPVGASSSELGTTVLETEQTAMFVLDGDYSGAAQLTVKVVAIDGTFIEYTKTFVY